MVATDKEPKPAPDRTWERLIDEMMPVPWDERDRTWLARALDTILQLAVHPKRFFRSMATDRDGGATRLALASILGASFGLSWVLTGLVMGAGSTVSPFFIGIEVGLSSALALFCFGAFRALVTAVAIRLSGRRIRGVRRVAAFSTAPMILGFVPVVGLLAGVVLGTRAYATGVRVRFGFSWLSAWLLALVPAPVLFVVASSVLLRLVGA